MADKIAIPNARQPFGSEILVGGQPTPEQFKELADAGYIAIINLRPDAELQGRDEEAEVQALDMRYVHIPVGGPDDVTEENAQRLHDALDSHDGPVVVHCASSNRVGALFALRAGLLLDVDANEAIELGRQAGMTSLEPLVQKHLGT